MLEEIKFKDELLNQYIDKPMWFYLLNKFPEIDEDLLEIRLTELVKYLYIGSCIKGPLLVTQELDEIWHAMILETRAYYNFCKLLPGGRYIHHSSNDYEAENKIEVDDSPEAEVIFYANYVKEFNGFTDSSILYWPGALALKEASGCQSTHDFNAFLKSISVQ